MPPASTTAASPSAPSLVSAEATGKPHWRSVVRHLASVLQCCIALAVVYLVSQHSQMPYITPYLVVMMSFSMFDWLVRKNHPNVYTELLRPGIPLTDRLTFVGGGLLLTVHFVLGVADATYFHWTGGMPGWVHVTGLVVMTLGFLFATWAMLLNPYFSPIVRVQEERGHKVITSGPYSVVRHPSYFGLGIGAIASAFALGSIWSLIPALLFILVYARRAVIEDGKLRAELDGFDQYATRVRSRMIPMVW